MFTTFDNALAGCVKEDKITREEALRQATDPENVRRYSAAPVSDASQKRR